MKLNTNIEQIISYGIIGNLGGNAIEIAKYRAPNNINARDIPEAGPNEGTKCF